MESDASGSAGPWRFAQCFGDKGEVEDITEGNDLALPASLLSPSSVRLSHIIDFDPSHARPDSADIISTVEFDHTGDYLATGDKGGRVVLFERNESVRHIRFCLAQNRGPPYSCEPFHPLM